MAHNCIDWTTKPPTRKIPLLVLTRGADRVYTIVPKEFKTLEDIAKKVFNLGDVDIKISSSCVNLCDGLPARITEASWEHVSAYIGCATVEVVVPRVVEVQAPQEPPSADEDGAVAREEQPLDADESDHRLDMPNAPGAEAMRDDVEDAPSHHGEDNDRPATPENHDEQPRDEEVSVVLPRKPRRQQRVVSENEDDGEGNEPEQEDQAAKSQASPVAASPPKPEIKKERKSDYRHESEAQPAGPALEIKKEQKSDYHYEPGSQPAEELDRPIKREKREAGSAKSASHSQSQSQSEARPQASAESGDNIKLMIRVAHRPSKQESKFTTKSTTKVHKVLTSACKSFSLDASRATLYLIISMEDESGEVENLFPCDKSDTIARAGAERSIESRFLLKIAGEA